MIDFARFPEPIHFRAVSIATLLPFGHQVVIAPRILLFRSGAFRSVGYVGALEAPLMRHSTRFSRKNVEAEC